MVVDELGVLEEGDFAFGLDGAPVKAFVRPVLHPVLSAEHRAREGPRDEARRRGAAGRGKAWSSSHSLLNTPFLNKEACTLVQGAVFDWLTDRVAQQCRPEEEGGTSLNEKVTASSCLVYYCQPLLWALRSLSIA